MVDAARPNPDVVVHLLFEENILHRLRRGNDRIATLIESAQQCGDRRLQKSQPIITKIGVKTGVNRGNDRKIIVPSVGNPPVSQGFRRRDVHHVWRKIMQVALDFTTHPICQPIIGSPRNGQRADANKIAGRRKRRVFNDRRIYSNSSALREQKADKAIERHIGPVERIIIVSAQ